MKKITVDEMKKAVKEYNFDFFEDLMQYHYGYCDANHYYDDITLDSYGLEEYIDSLSPSDAFRAGCYADFNWSDDIFYFDGYANIKSCSSALMFFAMQVDFTAFADWYNHNIEEEEEEEEEEEK